MLGSNGLYPVEECENVRESKSGRVFKVFVRLHRWRAAKGKSGVVDDGGFSGDVGRAKPRLEAKLPMKSRLKTRIVKMIRRRRSPPASSQRSLSSKRAKLSIILRPFVRLRRKKRRNVVADAASKSSAKESETESKSEPTAKCQKWLNEYIPPNFYGPQKFADGQILELADLNRNSGRLKRNWRKILKKFKKSHILDGSIAKKLSSGDSIAIGLIDLIDVDRSSRIWADVGSLSSFESDLSLSDIVPARPTLKPFFDDDPPVVLGAREFQKTEAVRSISNVIRNAPASRS